MTITTEQKQQIMADYATKEGDTGSPEVQVALLTARIIYLTAHFKEHHKDNHSRRGLIALVNRRRRLLDYLKSKNVEAYQTLIKRLNIRK